MRPARGRGVAVTNGAIAAALVAVLAVVALVVHPPSPPGIAEFAPQASKPITKAPPRQSAVHGADAGPCLIGAVCMPGQRAAARPTPMPSTSRPLGVPSALQCFSWPDGSITQTFDPQSPPCIASWPEAAKGNGGASTPGVTRTEIRVAVSGGPFESDAALLEHFNTHYQLYGRRFRLIYYDNHSSYTGASGQRADAATIAKLRVFAATQWSNETVNHPDTSTFSASLVRHGILSVTDSGSTFSEADLRSPYRWSYSPSIDTIERATAGLVCRNLQPGRFAVLRPKYTAVPSPTANPLLTHLAACGIKPEYAEFDADAARAGYPNPDSALTQLMLDWKRQGVTHIISLCGLLDDAPVFQSANSVDFRPYWVRPGTFEQYSENYLTDPQLAKTLGLATRNKLLPPGSDPAHVAAGVGPQGYVWAALYRQLLLLASGVQMAGPRLTPHTFGYTGEFPNPAAGKAPSWQASVSLAGEEHSFVRDFGVWWWDQSQSKIQASVATPGGLCWVGRGSRWPADQIPPGLRLFTGPCR